MKPKIFRHTIYRLPTKEELIDVNNYNLNSDEIINGFTYTIVGRGIKSTENKKTILKSIEMLFRLFPKNNEYNKALIKLNYVNENKIIQIINEEISAITKNKKEEIFNYHSIIEDSWNEAKSEAQKFQRINFDFENDYSTGQKKRFYAKVMLRKDQPVKNEINAELMEAGGDWEVPVMYFRLEFTHQYGLISNKYCNNPEFVWDVCDEHGNLVHGSGNRYVIIPPIEAGNKLKKGHSTAQSNNKKWEWFAYDNSELSKEEEIETRITDNDKRKAWEWLQKLLNDLVKDRHEMLDDHDDTSDKITVKEINFIDSTG